MIKSCILILNVYNFNYLQIFVPLLANPENHKNWATVVSLDVKEHVHSLKSTVYQVKGQINGQTILPMPVGVERLGNIEKTVKERYVIILGY